MSFGWQWHTRWMNEWQQYIASERNERLYKSYIAETSECIWYVTVIHRIFYIMWLIQATTPTRKHIWGTSLNSFNFLYMMLLYTKQFKLQLNYQVFCFHITTDVLVLLNTHNLSHHSLTLTVTISRYLSIFYLALSLCPSPVCLSLCCLFLGI